MVCKLKLLFFTMCLCISSGAQASSICNSASSIYNASNCIETEFTKNVDKILGIIKGISENDKENINKGTNNNNIITNKGTNNNNIITNKGTNNNNIITYLRNRMVRDGNILSNIQLSIFNYLKNCKVESKDQVLSELSRINKYHNYLFNSIFRTVFNNNGKVSSILLEALVSNTENVTNFIKSIESGDKSFDTQYKCYKSEKHKKLLVTKYFVEIASKIQEIVTQYMRNFAISVKQFKFKNITDEFSKLIEKYNTFINSNSIKLNSKEEKFLHALYLSDIFNNYINNPNTTSNYAYATVTYNNNTILLNADDYYDKCVHSFNKISENNRTLKFCNKYDYNSSELMSLKYISGTTDNEMTKICKQYLQSNGRGLVKDNEFLILLCLFKNIDDIVKLLLNKCDKNATNPALEINIFTYMDMCPSCWTAWHKCFDDLERLYQTKLSTNAKLNVNVYSIKPYVIDHPFVFGIIEKNRSNLNKSKVMNISDWVYINIRNSIRLEYISEAQKQNMELKFINYLSNNDIKIKQLFDWDGFNMLNDYYNHIQIITNKVIEYYIINKIKSK